MVRKAKKLPLYFSSFHEMHEQGFYVGSEIQPIQILQNWTNYAKECNLSFPELAQQAGIHRQSLYAAAEGKSRLSLESAFRICAVLQLSIEEAFTVENLYAPCLKEGKPIYLDMKTLQVVPATKLGFKEGKSSNVDSKNLQPLYRCLLEKEME